MLFSPYQDISFLNYDRYFQTNALVEGIMLLTSFNSNATFPRSLVQHISHMESWLYCFKKNVFLLRWFTWREIISKYTIFCTIWKDNLWDIIASTNMNTLFFSFQNTEYRNRDKYNCALLNFPVTWVWSKSRVNCIFTGANIQCNRSRGQRPGAPGDRYLRCPLVPHVA